MCLSKNVPSAACQKDSTASVIQSWHLRKGLCHWSSHWSITMFETTAACAGRQEEIFKEPESVGPSASPAMDGRISGTALKLGSAHPKLPLVLDNTS